MGTAEKDTSPKTNMDTQNDGLEKVGPFVWPFLVSIPDFWGVILVDRMICESPKVSRCFN